MSPDYTNSTLADTHIVVTGGGTGLGFEMAKRFTQLGAKVSINGRRSEKLDAAVAEITEAGGTASGIVCDVRDPESVESFLCQAEEAQGPVTGLVNNAAANFLSDTATLSPRGFDAIVQTNLYGTFHCTQACGRRWLDRKTSGNVVSIATTYTEPGSAFVVPSAVSKAGIVTMMKSLAAEWGPYGIRLNVISPGPIPTDGAWDRLVPDPRMEAQFKERLALRRFGEPIEVANLAVYLLSDLSSFLTGENICLDGGEHLAGGLFNPFTSMPREQILGMLEMMRGREGR
jgi:NAD(P)-dependent dehydrogenase (short-subunit alcohol dehydrogenase family)